jgi:MscS family membrane protein
MRLESFAARDRIRFAAHLGLVYGTTREQLQFVLGRIEELLLAHPKIWPEGIVVRFKELGESALVIELQAWFQTADFAEFQQIREGLLFAILEIVEKAKTELAYPTRTLHVVGQTRR